MEILSKHSNATQENQMLVISHETYNKISPNYSSRVRAEPKDTTQGTQAMAHPPWYYDIQGLLGQQNIALQYKQTSTWHNRTQIKNIVSGPVILHVTDRSHAAHTKENIISAWPCL